MMTNSEKPQQAPVHGQSKAVRFLKWTAIVAVILFLVTRVIRFFLQ
jgi:hypothetical protein